MDRVDIRANLSSSQGGWVAFFEHLGVKQPAVAAIRIDRKAPATGIPSPEPHYLDQVHQHKSDLDRPFQTDRRKALYAPQSRTHIPPHEDQ